MDKQAQFGSNLSGKSVEDLYSEIIRDPSLSYGERQQLIAQLAATLQAPPNTPLSSVIWKLSGAGLGYLIGKYFGLGRVGKVVLSATGMGLGTLINNKINTRPPSRLDWLGL